MHDVATRTLTARDLIGDLLLDQQSLTAVDQFVQRHDGAAAPLQAKYYGDLIALQRPGEGEQFAFQVDRVVWPVVLAVGAKIAAEAAGLSVGGSRHLVLNQLRATTRLRVLALGLGLAVFHWSPLLAPGVILLGELMERLLYFRAVIEPKMPGVI